MRIAMPLLPGLTTRHPADTFLRFPDSLTVVAQTRCFPLLTGRFDEEVAMSAMLEERR